MTNGSGRPYVCGQAAPPSRGKRTGALQCPPRGETSYCAARRRTSARRPVRARCGALLAGHRQRGGRRARDRATGNHAVLRALHGIAPRGTTQFFERYAALPEDATNPESFRALAPAAGMTVAGPQVMPLIRRPSQPRLITKETRNETLDHRHAGGAFGADRRRARACPALPRRHRAAGRVATGGHRRRGRQRLLRRRDPDGRDLSRRPADRHGRRCSTAPTRPHGGRDQGRRARAHLRRRGVHRTGVRI